MELAYAHWWEQLEYSLPVLSYFQVLLTCPFFFFTTVSRILQKFLALYSIKSNYSAHAALFWSTRSWPMSLAKVFRPVFLAGLFPVLSLWLWSFKSENLKAFCYQSVKSCILFLTVFCKLLLHFDSKDFPESPKWRGNSTLKADHVWKDSVNIKYSCVINYKISLAVFSTYINLAHLNCKYVNYDTVNL
jgi:hypothetical protein